MALHAGAFCRLLIHVVNRRYPNYISFIHVVNGIFIFIKDS